jgi:hypothetical protein
VEHRSSRAWGVVAALFGFTVLSLAYAITSPPFENPDELSHAEYAAFMADAHRLPVLERDCVRMAFHPPLYHLLLAPIAAAMGLGAEAVTSGHHVDPAFPASPAMLLHGYPDERFPFAGASRFVFVGRLVSIACGVLLLLYVDRLMTAWSDDPTARLVGVASVAAIPQLQYLAASLNHDMLAAACAAAVLSYSVRLLDEGVRPAAATGVALGLGLLTKASLLPLAVLPALALATARGPAVRRRRDGAVVYGIAFLIGGWWYLRNVALYGHPLPTVRLHETTWLGAGLVHDGPVDAAYLAAVLRQLFQSFWFLAGLMNVTAERWMYEIWAAVSGVALAGIVLLCGDRRGRLLAAGWIAVFTAVVEYNFHVYSAQGRYLFIVAPVGGAAVARAWLAVPRPARRPASLVFVGVLGLTSAACFARAFLPAYATTTRRDRPPTAETARLFCANEYTQVVRGDGRDWRGIDLRGRRAGPDPFDLEIALRGGDGATLRSATVQSASFGTQLSDVAVPFDALQTRAGERYVVALRAPNATPRGKPVLEYVRASGDDSFMVDDARGPGTLALRTE